LLTDEELRDAEGFGLTPDEVRTWAPFYPLETYWAKKHHLALETARLWAGHGVPIRDTVKAVAVGLTLDEIDQWVGEGFTAADASEAKETGVDIAQVVAWRQAGFIAPDALQLIRDGWELGEAAAARYAGVDRYGVSSDPA
jgi:hypothetical protein